MGSGGGYHIYIYVYTYIYTYIHMCVRAQLASDARTTLPHQPEVSLPVQPALFVLWYILVAHLPELL